MIRHRPLYSIAEEISSDWKSPSYGARPYLAAMYSLAEISSRYGADDAKGIILYFLSNAGTWKGPTAKRIKAELKAILKGS